MVDADLQQMMNFFSVAPEIYRASPFWADLSRIHIKQLESSGFENFKRTVNTRYFNWQSLGILRHQFTAVALQWLRQPAGDIFSAEFPNPAPFNRVGAWAYKTFIAMYAEILQRYDRLNLLATIREPMVGNPFIVRHRGLELSQDLCNSVHEFYSVMGPDPDQSRQMSICELGAGYGRLAYLFLMTLPGASYCIVDIPPALYLSQRYLTMLFPETPIFRFRPFTRFEDVREEFEASRIRFLATPQIELLPSKIFDCFVNISSLHEMTVAQVKNYFYHMDRLCRGQVYTKQWRVSRAKVNGCVFRENEYPVPASWRPVYHRKHAIQRMFFEALYKVPGHEP